MSYINEALKKAQKDKDAGRAGYMRAIGKPGGTKRSFDIRFILLISVIILLLLFFLYSWSKKQEHQSTEDAVETIVHNPVQNIQKNSSVQVRKNINPPEENLTTAENKEQNIKEILYKQAVSFFEDNKIEEAKNIYKEILSLDPGHINSLNDLGVLFLQEERYDDAISHLEKAVKLKPGFVNPVYNLACAYTLRNEGEKGMKYLQKAIEIDEKAKEWASQDPDLKNLKEYAEFTLLTD